VNPIAAYYVQAIGIIMQMDKVARWMVANGEHLDNRAALILGAWMMKVANYAQTTLIALRNPTVQVPLEKITIFY
jgi:hypothetical protein